MQQFLDERRNVGLYICMFTKAGCMDLVHNVSQGYFYLHGLTKIRRTSIIKHMLSLPVVAYSFSHSLISSQRIVKLRSIANRFNLAIYCIRMKCQLLNTFIAKNYIRSDRNTTYEYHHILGFVVL